MRLKVITAALLLFAISMIALAPWILGPRPERGAGLDAYGVRFAFIVVAIALALFCAAVCAVAIARRARAEYRSEVQANLKELIESSLGDHRRGRDK